MLEKKKTNKNGNPCTRKTNKTAKKRNKKVQMVSLVVGDIHSEARGGRGDEEDKERGSCRAKWVITTGQSVLSIIVLRCVCVAMRQRRNYSQHSY